MSKSKTYEVIVSNWGCVYSGPTTDTANAYFEDYVNVSKTGKGRAGGESVTLMCDGEPVREYFPELEASRAIDKVKTLTGLYDYLMGGVIESFEVDEIGADFAYMVGAVLKGGKCSWPEDRPFVRLLQAMSVSLIPLQVKLLRHIEIEDIDWEEQGWDADSRETLLREFIAQRGLDGQLETFLRHKAREENEG